MDVPITALTAVGAGLLVLAGLAKIPRPDGAMATLHRLRLPSGRVAARALGAGEVVAGVAILLVGGLPAAVTLAILYGVFAAVSAWQRSRQLSCGCFGTSDTAVTAPHVVTNALLALTGLAGLAAPPASAAAVADDAGVLGTAAGLLLLGTGVLLLRTMLVTAAARQVRRRPLTTRGMA